MNLRLEQDRVKADKRTKSNNARCIYCRKCLNSGLCLMPWPEFNGDRKKKASSSLYEFDITNINNDK